MSNKLTIDFIWVPKSLGGHNGDPYEGMRVNIRWQDHIEAYLKWAKDFECISLKYSPKSLRGTAIFSYRSEPPIPTGWLLDGKLIELLNGFRVLAIGRIITQSET